MRAEDQNRIPNPYIKCYLLPERHCYCKSQIHPKTVKPTFNEVFAFDAAVDSLSWRMLQLTMYDFERFKRHEIIGNVLMRDLFENSNPYCWTEYTMNIISNHVGE
ncbi:unnamed protein product [Soboliphyme baturini]|uniref:C2 domain-containing protein n=1 Tax=Soboliphyme baturini TaxID=241478 RepID=A0A183J4M3_9BILA|nr:unnamed protein product [Soboliphyme baturini]